MALDGTELDALIARARNARHSADLKARAHAARLDAEVLEDLLFEIAVEIEIVRSRARRVALPPALEARMLRQLVGERTPRN